jgi:PTS system ascorbate-specific IIA component
MIATMTDLGPYLVIAPGVALAHARPSPSVLRTGLSCVTLAAPVRFGHRDNDPVVLVIGLAASDNRSHIQALATLAALLADTETRAALLAAREPAEVQAVIAAFESARAAEERSAAPVAGKGET